MRFPRMEWIGLTNLIQSLGIGWRNGWGRRDQVVDDRFVREKGASLSITSSAALFAAVYVRF